MPRWPKTRAATPVRRANALLPVTPRPVELPVPHAFRVAVPAARCRCVRAYAAAATDRSAPPVHAGKHAGQKETRAQFEARAAGRTKGSWAAPAPQPASDVANRDDLVFARTARCEHLDDIAFGLADQCTSHRARHRDFAGADIGFDIANDLIGQALARFDFLDFDRGTKDGTPIDIQCRGVDDLCVGKRAFQFFDAAFDERLTLTGGVVLGIFGEVALRPGFRDGVDHLGAIDRFQTMQFGLQALSATYSQRNRRHTIS